MEPHLYLQHPQHHPHLHSQHTVVERFLKLGYSHGDILRVLESLCQDAQTNDILEELIKTCPGRSAAAAGQRGSGVSTATPRLVARGCSLPEPSPGPVLAPAGGGEPEPVFRPVVIDGSNVAMSHGNKKVFSCRGLQLAVMWFWEKGLRDITVFVPLWRKEQPRPEAPITDQHLLHELERRKILVYTPSRCVNGKRVVCYDDRYIVKLAFDSDGIIVSNDNYRDLQTENPQWKRFIEERLLMFTFANDKFMPPDDPLGRNGPTIGSFLRKMHWVKENKLQHCPYGKKCTYGAKCKFYHPERTNQSQLSVADELRAKSRPVPDGATPTHLPVSHQDVEHSCHPLQSYLSSTTPPPPPRREAGGRECLGSEPDEAFGSLDSAMYRLGLQDQSASVERLSSGFSSGIAGGDDGYPGFYSNGRDPPQIRGCSACAHHPKASTPLWPPCPPAGTPCSALCRPPVSFSEQRPAHSQLFPYRQTHGEAPPTRWSSLPTPSAGEECRRAMSSQLSTLFPQRTVEHVMSEHPYVDDLSELISLIQSYRTSHVSY